MQDHRKRIIVDGVDFAELFQFHRIALAISAALQPARLIIGLLIVLAIITFGKGWDKWDRMAGPSISPDGLLAGEITEAERRSSRRAMMAAVLSFAPTTQYPEPADDPESWKIEQLQPLIADLPTFYRQHLAVDESDAARRATEVRLQRISDDLERTRPRSPWEATSTLLSGSFESLVVAVSSLDIATVASELSTIFYHMPCALWSLNKPFAIVFGLFLVFILAIGGGALSRMAATQIAGQERLRVRAALGFSVGNWRRFSLALLLPVLLTLLIAGIIVVLGLLMAVPWVDVIGGLVYGIAILLGFVMAFLLLGFAAGFSLLVPAVACENCDPGDAMQRTFAYVINRPLHLLFYAIVALIGMVLGYVVVAFVASLMLNLTAATFGALHDHPALHAAGGYSIFDLVQTRQSAVFDTWHDASTAWFVHLWETIVVCLVIAYVVAYYYSASTVMYLLLRRAADGQDIDEIWRPGLVPGTLAPLPSPPVRSSAGK